MGKCRRGIHSASVTIVVVILIGVSAAVGTAPAEAAPPPTFDAHGSVEQVYVTDLASGEEVALADSGGATVATQHATAEGGVLFRNVTPGTGYRVKATGDGSESVALTVHTDAEAPWDSSIYNNPIDNNGYQYLTTRDGTKLAIDVHLPIGADPKADKQYPTLIEYSGYGYADPAGGQSSIAMVANAMGFAVVDVNMRGTGCSGGAFDFFETLQNLDGYDVIETIAHQPWVLNNKVGMFGISYGGISQLFTAQTNPPDLAAIAPLSVIDATASTLYPGGILNTGFALSWAQGRVDDAQPTGPHTGQKWAYKKIQAGDTICAANQDLHGAAVNLIQKVNDNSHYDPPVADPLDPVSFVGKIHAPVFLACQWEDEQTGGHCPELARHMTGTDHKWFTFTNGAHIDSLDPATLTRLYDFLELFVAKRPPTADMGLARAFASTVYQTAMGVPSSDKITIPADPIQGMADYDSALAAFEKLPEVRVRFDNGAGTAPTGGTTAAGDPYAGFEHSFTTFPAPGTQAQKWYLGPDGTLGPLPAGGEGIDAYTSDASALAATNYDGNTGTGGLWGNASQWAWKWKQNPAGNAVSYVTAPLAQNTTVLGTGAVYLWVKSSTPDVDLQATISEVTPSGNETFVQNGWIRASERKLSTGVDNVFKRPGTEVSPIPSFTTTDAAPMPTDQFVKVAIPLYYQGHAYRSGSRIRVTIAAPGGAQPVWAFADTKPATGTAQIQIAYSAAMPSRLVLPVVPGLSIPTGQPACPSLRNEPCRPYVPYANTVVEVPPATTTTTTTSTTTSTVAPTTTVAVAPAPSKAAGSPPSPHHGGLLPVTGADLWLLLGAAGVLVLGGFALVRFARLRRSPG